MTASQSRGAIDYGALELKRYYQRSMALGVLIAAGIHLLAIGSVLLVQFIKAQARGGDDIPIVRISALSEIAAPPSMTEARPQISISEPDIAPPSIGIPTPVPDEEVVEEVRFATRAELAELQAPMSSSFGSGSGDSVVVDISLDDYFPAPSEFVAVEEQPVPIKRVEPPYPEIARLTGTEGTVWVQALVDKTGKVRDARVAKSSGSNVGFDEAAVEAALQCIYKPAIQNGQPVAVWVTYPVEFKLK
ncbi:MAG TPA: energy transducer TonB [candidate division Zixibacteria bacterium]|jgi:protein TonB